MIRRFRSAVTGMFVSAARAAVNQDTTVSETLRNRRRAIDRDLESAILGRIAVGLQHNGISAQDALRSIRDLLDHNTLA